MARDQVVSWISSAGNCSGNVGAGSKALSDVHIGVVSDAASLGLACLMTGATVIAGVVRPRS